MPVHSHAPVTVDRKSASRTQGEGKQSTARGEHRAGQPSKREKNSPVIFPSSHNPCTNSPLKAPPPILALPRGPLSKTSKTSTPLNSLIQIPTPSLNLPKEVTTPCPPEIARKGSEASFAHRIVSCTSSSEATCTTTANEGGAYSCQRSVEVLKPAEPGRWIWAAGRKPPWSIAKAKDL